MSNLVTQWGQIKFICPCGGDGKHNYHFDLVEEKRQIYYKCLNESCGNTFPADLHMKAMDLINRYYEQKGTIEGFSAYFKVHDESMRLRYLQTIQVTDDYRCFEVEVANLTRHPEYKTGSKKTSTR